MNAERQPYDKSGTSEGADEGIESNPAQIQTAPASKSSLVAVGGILWLAGRLLSSVVKSQIANDGFTPQWRGVLFAAGMAQLIGSAILLFCLGRFIYRKWIKPS